MAAVNACACGWTIVSPLGEEDVWKHTIIHLRDAHPSLVMTDDELRQHIKTI